MTIKLLWIYDRRVCTMTMEVKLLWIYDQRAYTLGVSLCIILVTCVTIYQQCFQIGCRFSGILCMFDASDQITSHI